MNFVKKIFTIQNNFKLKYKKKVFQIEENQIRSFTFGLLHTLSFHYTM